MRTRLCADPGQPIEAFKGGLMVRSARRQLQGDFKLDGLVSGEVGQVGKGGFRGRHPIDFEIGEGCDQEMVTVKAVFAGKGAVDRRENLKMPGRSERSEERVHALDRRWILLEGALGVGDLKGVVSHPPIGQGEIVRGRGIAGGRSGLEGRDHLSLATGLN
ncbi:MAG: hypothetical protein WA047_15725 [Phenylobacterium sp.]|uniref:hypothetical protein n=1 Tax=Phenylobacterium sp. TaxID=1871053 RepID=UPI003BB51DEC